MGATTTQLLSSGKFCKLRYDIIPVKSAYSNVSFNINNSKNAKFWVLTLLSQMGDIVYIMLAQVLEFTFLNSHTCLTRDEQIIT